MTAALKARLDDLCQVKEAVHVHTEVQTRVNEIKALTVVLMCAGHGRLAIEKDQSASDAPSADILQWYGDGLAALADLIDRKCQAIVNVIPS